jgi:hypothetical protein
MGRFVVPLHVIEVLDQFDCTIIGEASHVGDNGHPTIQFKMPDGSVRRWSWPLERRAGLRAMKNNRSQLRKKLLEIKNESRSVQTASAQRACASSR